MAFEARLWASRTCLYSAPHPRLKLQLPRAQRPQLSPLELPPCLPHILLPRQARLSLLKHKSDWALSCSNTFSGSHCPASSWMPATPASRPLASLPAFMCTPL